MAIPVTGRQRIKKAVEVLQADGVVAIPTETVYGLAANIYSKKAIAKIYRIKKRPRTNPLIVHVASLEMAKELVTSFPRTARKLVSQFWPGPLTLILPKSRKVGHWLTAGGNTVGIRMPDHPLTLQLIKEAGMPLAAPSANPFTYISPVTARQVRNMLGDKVDYILDGGRCKKGIESTIVAVRSNRVTLLRTGAITEEQIEKALGRPLQKKTTRKTAYPGMFRKHYSPHTPLWLTEDVYEAMTTLSKKKVALLSFQKKYALPRKIKQLQLSRTGDMKEAAANLYDHLHRLDRGGFDYIISEKAPDEGLGKAINERLKKAASP